MRIGKKTGMTFVFIYFSFCLIRLSPLRPSLRSSCMSTGIKKEKGQQQKRQHGGYYKVAKDPLCLPSLIKTMNGFLQRITLTIRYFLLFSIGFADAIKLHASVLLY